MSLRDQLGRWLPPAFKSFLFSQLRSFTTVMNVVFRGGKTVKINGVVLAVDRQSLSKPVASQLLAENYEGREARMVKMFLSPDDIVLELGAGMGYIGLLCARTVGSENVHSFEANPSMEKLIRKNYELNSLEPNLQIGLVSCKSGLSDFYIPEDFWAASISPQANAKVVTVRQYAINDLVQDIQPTFLIMDIEGAEIDIIEALVPKTVKKIAMELHPETTGAQPINAMIDRLKSHGLDVHWRSNAGDHIFFQKSV